MFRKISDQATIVPLERISDIILAETQRTAFTFPYLIFVSPDKESLVSESEQLT